MAADHGAILVPPHPLGARFSATPVRERRIAARLPRPRALFARVRKPEPGGAGRERGQRHALGLARDAGQRESERRAAFAALAPRLAQRAAADEGLAGVVLAEAAGIPVAVRVLVLVTIALHAVRPVERPLAIFAPQVGRVRRAHYKTGVRVVPRAQTVFEVVAAHLVAASLGVQACLVGPGVIRVELAVAVVLDRR